MTEQILITGGAGFIGGHLARRLLGLGHAVRVLDNLTEQVHEGRGRPRYLPDDVELIVGDVRDRASVQRALDGVGVGQSMYEIADYASVNTHGTAVLLEAMIERPIRKLLVASSMSVYGEGLYRDRDGNHRPGRTRSATQLQSGRWELADGSGRTLEPVPTPESKVPELASNYALGKYDQERMCLLFGGAYRVPTVALRFFNVYGVDQALSNPYTGVLAIFANRLLGGRPPLIFEDGAQRRDFVSVRDVARACALAIATDAADGRAVNVASGRDLTVGEIAARVARAVDRPELVGELTGRSRVGDIRHCFADVRLADELLGYRAQVRLEDGIAELAEWLDGRGGEDRVESATAELATRGLAR